MPGPSDSNKAMSAPKDLSKATNASSITVKQIGDLLTELYNSNLSNQSTPLYANVGSQVLLSLNSWFNNSDRLLNHYYNFFFAAPNSPTTNQNAKDSGFVDIDPHIYKLVGSAYTHMIYKRQSQAIIFQGFIGSGKSYNKQLALQMLQKIATGSESLKTFDKIQAGQQLMDLFINSSIDQSSPCSSRASTLLKIYYDADGNPVGSKHSILHYESNRFGSNYSDNVPRSVRLPSIKKLNSSSGTSSSQIPSTQYSNGSEASLKNLDKNSDFQQPSFFIIEVLKKYVEQHFSSESTLDLGPELGLSTKPSVFDFNELKEGTHDELIALQSLMKSVGISTKTSTKTLNLLLGITILLSSKVINNVETNTPKLENFSSSLLGLLGFVNSEQQLMDLINVQRSTVGISRVDLKLSLERTNAKKKQLCWILYRQVVYWLEEAINYSLGSETTDTSISLVDPMGTNNIGSHFDLLAINFFNERIFRFMNFEIFEAKNIEYAQEANTKVPIIKSVPSNSECLDLLISPKFGIFYVIENQSNFVNNKLYDLARSKNISRFSSVISQFKPLDQDDLQDFDFNSMDADIANQISSSQHIIESRYFEKSTKPNCFQITHYFGKSEYNTTGFTKSNLNESKPYFDFEFGYPISSLNSDSFASALLSPTNLSSENSQDSDSNSPFVTISKVKQNANNAISSFESSNSWFVICLLGSISFSKTSFSSKYLINQLSTFNMDLIVQRKRVEYFISFEFQAFSSNFIDNSADKRHILGMKSYYKLDDKDFFVSKNHVYLSYECFFNLNYLVKNSLLDPMSYYDNIPETLEPSTPNLKKGSGNKKETGTASRSPLKSSEKGVKYKKENNSNSNTTSSARKLWLTIVYSLSFYIPTFVISGCFGIKGSSRQVAWREKFAICFLIFLFCSIVIFIVGIAGLLLCPKQNIYSPSELTGHASKSDALIAIRGEVFNIKDYIHHGVTFDLLFKNGYLGKDQSKLFPYQLSYVCDGLNIDPRLSMQDKPVLYSDAYFHDHRWYRHSAESSGYNYYQYYVMRALRRDNAHGRIAYDPKILLKQGIPSTSSDPVYRVIINKQVFDLSSYISADGAPFVITPDGISNDTATIPQGSRDFLPTDVRTLFRQNNGQDITELWLKYKLQNPNLSDTVFKCLRGAFYIGDVDFRKSVRCYFANYMLLAGSVFIVLMVFVKFAASVRIGNKDIEPEVHDTFVICNVPCYSENEESLLGTIDSIARLRFDDKQKLILIICDGIVTGSGNEKSTPDFVKSILGIADVEPEPLSYLALGEPSRQHNMAQAYSGLYESSGHTVPYLLIVKCGTPSESNNRGNRGKRDSQILVMRFLNKVFFDLPMTPLELEMYHQMKNVIGVPPAMYEYILMVDADTIVSRLGLAMLLSTMQNDEKIMGICGETQLQNPKSSWTSMLQVYEYFIAHFMAKSFESLFGTVTCLPGCFCMYRIKSANGKTPLLVSSTIVEGYSTNKAETLHEKNLLLLGEDRYLTTLMLKNFTNYKTKFVGTANCKTNAPESWRVLLSQRRRWINSTVHNLLELLLLPNLCGFCCFSMRFVVLVDLITTLILPATMFYLVILIYQLTNSATSLVSVYLLASLYVLQAMVFILHRQWQHIGWMIIYLLATPLYTFIIPVYSFWHFDDFSWGNTRKLANAQGSGHGKGKDEEFEMEEFDPKSIPMTKWSEYERELLWEMQSNYLAQQRSQAGSRFSQSRPPSAPIPQNMSRPGSSYSNPPMPRTSFIRSSSAMPMPQQYPVNVNVPSNPNMNMNIGMNMGMNMNMSQMIPAHQQFQQNRNTVYSTYAPDNFSVPGVMPVGGMNNQNRLSNYYSSQININPNIPTMTQRNSGMLNEENPYVANLSTYVSNTNANNNNFNQSAISGASNNPLLASNQQQQYQQIFNTAGNQTNRQSQHFMSTSPTGTDSATNISSNNNTTPIAMSGNVSGIGSGTEPGSGLSSVPGPSGVPDEMIYNTAFEILSNNDVTTLSRKEARTLIAQKLGMHSSEVNTRKKVFNDAIKQYFSHQQ